MHFFPCIHFCFTTALILNLNTGDRVNHTYTLGVIRSSLITTFPVKTLFMVFKSSTFLILSYSWIVILHGVMVIKELINRSHGLSPCLLFPLLAAPAFNMKLP